MNGVQIATEQHDEWTVLSVAGELDLATSPELREALEGAVHDQAHLIVDLSSVTFLDSTGLGILVQAHQRAEAAGTALRLVVTESSVRRVIEVTGLDKVFSLHETVGAATK